MRLSVIAAMGALGVAVSPAQSAAPVSAPAPLPGGAGDDGSAEEYRLLAALKQASMTSPSQEAALARLGAGLDLPAPTLRAYRFAESVMQRADPSCGLDWSLLAAIGHVESDHGRYGGAEVRPDGTSSPHILGPVLNGSADVAAIADTDAGRLDGDNRWDRAVGPMQFIPSTWAVVGSDADGNGVRDPHDIDDAALASAVYLCAGEADLGTTAGQRHAVCRYNHSRAYVDLVLRLAAAYARSNGIGLSLPTAKLTTTPVDLPTLQRPVTRPAHPATPPRAGMRDLPAVVRQAVDSLLRRSGDSSDGRSRTGAGAGSSATVGSVGGSGGTGAGGEGTTRGGSGSAGGTADSDAVSTGSTSGGSTGGSTGDSTGGSSGGSTDRTSGGSTDATSGSSTSDDSTSGSTEGTSTDGGDSTDGGGSTAGDGSTDAAEDAGTATISGVLRQAADGSWSVDANTVDFGDETYLNSTARHDFDGADGVESNLEELQTLDGQEVTAEVSDGNVVQALNGLDYR